MIITIGHSVQGHNIQKYIGLACGVTLRSADTSKKGLMDQIKGLADKARVQIQICKEAREEAYQAMSKHAESLGANAVIGVNFDSSTFAEDKGPITEICCFGTAVVVLPIQRAAVTPADIKK